VTAKSKYVQFHQHEPNKVGSFHRDLVIPADAYFVGVAKDVLYRSDKLNPETLEDEGWIDYIHEHDAGVRVYRFDREASEVGTVRAVPKTHRAVRELTWLGNCLGFSYTDHAGNVVDAKGKKPLPELYTTPSGRCLLVIQNKRKLLAMIWGGRLGVEPRGIVH
jgi:hypothetical protein